VIEEYVRPTRLIVDGELVVREALSEPEPVDFDGVGTLEAFNTDGLRTLASTLDVPNMREKTLRYPGHIELMRVMRESGFFSDQPMEVNGAMVSPRDLTSALLFPKWQYGPGEADLTVLRVIAQGQRTGRPTRMIWEMTDYYDRATDTRSMARTTGFPAAIMARRIVHGDFPSGPGVHPPENPGRAPGFCAAFLDDLTARGLDIRARVEARP
jgi:saccharopine dehydrogenase-like NADP-dependent oxidoreductase